MSKDHLTQSEIDRLIDSSLGESSIHKHENVRMQKEKEEEDQYAEQQFQDYEESRRTGGFTKSKNFDESKQLKKTVQLKEIKEQLHEDKKVKKENENKTNLTKPKKSQFHTFNLGSKDNLPYNYAKMKERQRELLLTTLTEENRNLKIELNNRQKQVHNLQKKYNILLTEKTVNTSTIREAQLEKQLTYLRRKMEKLENLQKITEQKEKYKTSMKKTQMKFIPEQQSNKRQSELLELIDKLKKRLIQSDEDMKILQNKLSEGLEHNDQLHRKMRRVQKLQYQIQKFTQHAQTDRMFIETLKEKVKDCERVIKSEKNERIKLETQLKRMQISQTNNSDVMKELQETRKEKELLENQLKDLTSNLMAKMVNKFNRKQDLDENDVIDI